MKKIILMALLFSTLFIRESSAEDEAEVKTAVSKVIQRFNKRNSNEETSTLLVTNENMREVSVETEEKIVPHSVVSENLEIIEPIKTAKFESSDMAYPSNGVIEKVEEKENPEVLEKVVSEKAKTQKNSHSLADIEANARKIIEEETQKVEDARKHALEKIDKAMKRVDEVKKEELQKKEAQGAF